MSEICELLFELAASAVDALASLLGALSVPWPRTGAAIAVAALLAATLSGACSESPADRARETLCEGLLTQLEERAPFVPRGVVDNCS